MPRIAKRTIPGGMPARARGSRLALFLIPLFLAACSLFAPISPPRDTGARDGTPVGSDTAAASPRITGTVRLGREPVAGAQVTAVPSLGDPEDARYQTVSDAAGRFAVSLPAGSYNLIARKPGAAACGGIRWNIQAATSVDIDLTGTGEIRGTVYTRAATGKLPPRVRIFVPGTDLVAVVGDSGVYTLQDVPGGTYSLAVRAAGHGLAKVDNVMVVPGQTAGAPDLWLPVELGKGDLAGSVRLADSVRLSGIKVSVYVGSSDPAIATTGTDGSYSVSDLDGTYVRIVIEKKHYGTATIHVPIFAGQTSRAPDVELSRNYPNGYVGKDPFGFDEPVHLVLSASDLVWDASGSVYFASAAADAIVRVDMKDGKVSTLQDSLSDPAGITSDGIGNLYVANTGAGTILKLVLESNKLSTVASGLAGAHGLASDGVGNLLVAVHSATLHGIVQVDLTTGQKSTIAGQAATGSTDAGGTAAQFFEPTGLTYDGAGNVYVGDAGNHRIRKIALLTGQVTTIAGGTRGFADGAGTAARFDYPSRLVYDGSGALYISDRGNNRIRKLTLSTSAVTTVAGAVAGLEDTAGEAARFDAPEGIAYAAGGFLFVADPVNARVRRVQLGDASVMSLDATISAHFQDPRGLAADGAGSLYVADTKRHRIRRIDLSTQAVSTVAGTTEGFRNGAGAAAKLRSPRGLALDGQGILYVADADNHVIRKVVLGSNEVTTVAGDTQGRPGFADGAGTAARFKTPWGLAWDGQGALFVADSGNFAIRKFTPATGAVVTVAGSGSAAFQDGAGTNAAFGEPAGLAHDGASTLYVADRANHRVRKIDTITWEVNTLAGNGVAGRTDAVGRAAYLNLPIGLALDELGNLVVAEEDGVYPTYGGLRKIEVASGVVRSFLQPPLVYDSAFRSLFSLCSDASGDLFVSSEYYSPDGRIWRIQ